MTDTTAFDQQSRITQQLNKRLAQFTEQMENLCEQAQGIVDQNLGDDGLVEEEAQKVGFMRTIHELGAQTTGTTIYDLKVSESELVEWLEEFCSYHNLPLESADEILEANTDTLTSEQRRWLMNFIQKWDKTV